VACAFSSLCLLLVLEILLSQLVEEAQLLASMRVLCRSVRTAGTRRRVAASRTATEALPLCRLRRADHVAGSSVGAAIALVRLWSDLDAERVPCRSLSIVLLRRLQAMLEVLQTLLQDLRHVSVALAGALTAPGASLGSEFITFLELRLPSLVRVGVGSLRLLWTCA